MILLNKIKALVETYQGFSLLYFAKIASPIMRREEAPKQIEIVS